MTHSSRTVAMKWVMIGLLGCSMARAGISSVVAQTAPPKKLTAGILWNQILPHHIMYIQEGHQGPIIYDFQDPNPCLTLFRQNPGFLIIIPIKTMEIFLRQM